MLRKLLAMTLIASSSSVLATDLKKSQISVPLIGEAKLRAELENKRNTLAAIVATEALSVSLFDFDSADIKREARNGLANSRATLAAVKGQLVIVGHCDEKGGAKYNHALGLRRANAVKEYLVSVGIDPNKIETVSYGNEQPVFNDEGKVNSYQSRRVEIFERK